MKQIKKFKDVPWKNPSYEDPWFAGYDADAPRADGHRIYVPKENSIGCISAAFSGAYKLGELRVGMGEWSGFTVSIEIGESAGQTVGWPHVHLVPK